MTTEDGEPRATVVAFVGPVVDIGTIDRIQTYQVMEHELEALDSLASAENQALGFFSAMGGIFASLVVTLLTSLPTDPWRRAVVILLGCGSAVATLWFGLVWNRVRKARPKLIERIRSRSRRSA